MNRTVRLLIAAALALPGLAAGVGLLLAPDGSVDRPLAQGRPAVVDLHPSAALMVWARTPEDVSCEVLPSARREGSSTTIENTLLFDRFERQEGGERWYGALAVVGDPAGPHELTCTGPSDLAVGAAPWSYGPRHDTLLRVLSLGRPVSDAGLAVRVAVPGLIAAAVVLVAGRRRRAKTAGAPGPPG